MATGLKRRLRLLPYLVPFVYCCCLVMLSDKMFLGVNPAARAVIDVSCFLVTLMFLVFLLQYLSRGLLGQRVISNDDLSRGLATEGLQHVGRNLSPLREIDSYETIVLDFVERDHQANSLLGICGMRGVGKTTLLRFVRDSYAHGSSFSYVFFVGAGTVDRLQHVLAVNIGLLGPIPDVAKAISTSLEGKPFLLLLDAVREWTDLAAVGLPMPLGHRQKVIFTTRNQPICTKMGCASNAIQMECLSEADAWSFFRDKVGDEIIHAHPHIKHLAKKMAAECRGLPSALCALGRAMATKRDVKEWRYAYDMLKRNLPRANEIQEIDDEGYSDLYSLEEALQNLFF